MSTDRNKALVRRYFEEILNRKNMRLADEVLSSNFTMYFPGVPVPLDREGFKQFVRGFLEAFPDLHHRVEDQIAEGDKVATRLTLTGTQEGSFQEIPATGNEIEVAAISIFRVVGDRLAEQWVEADNLGMLQQLGAIPESSSAR